MTIELLLLVTVLGGLWFVQIMLVRVLEDGADAMPVRAFLRVKCTTLVFVACAGMFACAAEAHADVRESHVSLPAMAKERLPLPRPEPPAREVPRLPQLVAVLPHRLRMRPATTALNVSKGPRHLSLVPRVENSGRHLLRDWRIWRTRRIT